MLLILFPYIIDSLHLFGNAHVPLAWLKVVNSYLDSVCSRSAVSLVLS